MTGCTRAEEMDIRFFFFRMPGAADAQTAQRFLRPSRNVYTHVTHTNERPWTPYISTVVHGYDKRVIAFLMTINIVYLLQGNGSETRLGRRG